MVQTRRSTTDSKTAYCDWELVVPWTCPAADGEPKSVEYMFCRRRSAEGVTSRAPINRRFSKSGEVQRGL